jgi:methionyl-tRNA formyltransferase
MLRIVFMGSDAIARPALDWLAGEGGKVGRVVGVFTQPDRPVGRGQQIRPNDIKLWAQAHNLPVFQPEKIAETERQQIAGLNPDLALVMAYGHILKQEVIDTPRLGTLNLHTSVLPKYRGASPIQTATACGDQETGVTLMRMVRQLDAGPVAEVERVAIGAHDTAAEVEAKLALACVPLLARCLPRIAAGTQPFTAQDETNVTFCRKLEKTDGVLDFTQPATVLAARINGLMPWPGCAVEINGQMVKLGLADALPGSSPAGEVRGADAEGLLVGAGQGILRLRKLQRPGGKMLPASEFLRGWPVAPGTRLPSHPMPTLVAESPFPRAKP